MRSEATVCKKCYFCLPLRCGLIAWAYLKLIMAALLLCFLLIPLYAAVIMYIQYDFLHTTRMVVDSISVVIVLIDIVLNMIFIVGANKKEVRLLRICFIYNVILWTVTASIALVFAGIIVHIIFSSNWVSLVMVILVSKLTIVFIYLFVHTYFLLLIRSEMVKLNNFDNFRIVKNVADAGCSLKFVPQYTQKNGDNHLSGNGAEDDISRNEDIFRTYGSKSCCDVVLT